MSSAIKQRTANISLATSSEHARAEAAAARDKICLLKQLVLELQRELESLNRVPTRDVATGLDFYDEVSNFEIEMIKRALKCANGHQGKAALLLNLKVNTLGAMIKRYNIHPDLVL